MGLTPMSDRYRRPDWVRRMIAMGPAAGGAERMIPIDAGALIDDARASTGIADAGDLGDGDWEGRFRLLVDAVNRGDQHVVGRLLTREEMARCLRTRFLMAERWRTEPAIAEEIIDRPIFVTGPARSGTSILFELLGLDPGLRTPIATDVMHPAPPPGTAAEEVTAMTEAEQELWADIQPEFAAMHELRADLPVECITFCSPSFAGNHWAMSMTELGDWLPDVTTDLAFHRAVLQTVQHGREPRQWLLKTPAYVTMLDELLGAYPDASVILTHRDPAKTMPSTVSIAAMIQWLRNDRVDLDGISMLVGALFGDAMVKVGQRRLDGSLPAVFGDVRFSDLMAEPADAIAAAYDGIRRVLTDGHRDAIASYLRDKPRGKHGAHRYTAEEWGFDADTLHRDLGEYLAQFEVAIEV